jgi:hypothetical protein
MKLDLLENFKRPAYLEPRVLRLAGSGSACLASTYVCIVRLSRC